jgi:hypothetical protein
MMPIVLQNSLPYFKSFCYTRPKLGGVMEPRLNMVGLAQTIIAQDPLFFMKLHPYGRAVILTKENLVVMTAHYLNNLAKEALAQNKGSFEIPGCPGTEFRIVPYQLRLFDDWTNDQMPS